MVFIHFFLLFLSFSIQATPIKDSMVLTSEESFQKSGWKEKLEERIIANPEYLEQKVNLNIAEKKEQQSFYSLIPDLQLYGSQTATQDLKSFSQTQFGLLAQMNLFRFGQDYFLLQSRKSALLGKKLEIDEKFLTLENQYLQLLFKNIFLRKKIEYYSEINMLKQKTLKVAEQRFEHGNLPRQQVEKVIIDMNNFDSQKLSLEKELEASELLIKKFDLQSFHRIWPFLELKDSLFQKNFSIENTELKKTQLEAQQNADLFSSVKSQYWPSLDLTGKYYKNMEDSNLPNQWELNLMISWKVWDNYSHRLNYLEAYKNQLAAENRLLQLKRFSDEQNDYIYSQLISAQKKLNKSYSSLKLLNNLYQDTEKLFSQGRLTVNELFQDQQLLMETKINFENDVLDFHQSLLNYCQYKSERVWNCFENK